MPWAGATFNRTDGTRVGASVWEDADGAGVSILPSDHDTHDQDITDGLEDTVKHNGDIPMTGTLNLAGNDIVNVDFLGVNFVEVTPGGSTGVRVTSTDAGGSSRPSIDARRLSTSPADFDLGGVFRAPFNDSALSEVVGSQFKAQLRVATAGAVETAWLVTVMDGAGGEVTSCMFGKDGVEDVGGVVTQSLNTSQLPQVEASGALVEFSNAVTPGLISTDATALILTFAGLQHADTGVDHDIFILLGESAGGYETSGYLSALTVNLSASSFTVVPPSTSFQIVDEVDETEASRGTIRFDRIEGSDTWQISGLVATRGPVKQQAFSGSLSLAGKLDRLQIKLDGGATWAAGTVSLTVVT